MAWRKESTNKEEKVLFFPFSFLFFLSYPFSFPFPFPVPFSLHQVGDNQCSARSCKLCIPSPGLGWGMVFTVPVGCRLALKTEGPEEIKAWAWKSLQQHIVLEDNLHEWNQESCLWALYAHIDCLSFFNFDCLTNEVLWDATLRAWGCSNKVI